MTGRRRRAARAARPTRAGGLVIEPGPAWVVLGAGPGWVVLGAAGVLLALLCAAGCASAREPSHAPWEGPLTPQTQAVEKAVDHAYRQGRMVAVYTTLEGLPAGEATYLLSRYAGRIGPNTPWVIHLPDDQNNSIPICVRVIGEGTGHQEKAISIVAPVADIEIPVCNHRHDVGWGHSQRRQVGRLG